MKADSPCRRARLLALLGLLALWTLGGCAGGGSGGDGGAAMPAAERQAAMAAVQGMVAALPDGLTTAQQNTELASAMSANAAFASAATYGEGGSGGVIATFADGQPYVVVNDGREDQQEAADAGMAQSLAARSGLPNGKKVLLFRAMGAAYKDIRGELGTMLTKAGYTVTPQEGTIDAVRAIRGPDIFYFDTHGVYEKDWGGPGKDMAVAWTSTPVTAANDAKYAAELAGANCTIVRMTALDHKDGTGKDVMANHYGVRDTFLSRNGVTFATNSLVYMDCCFLDAAPFNQTCRSAGASLYAGWTAAVLGTDATRAARFFFDRALGANSGNAAKENPTQRPFDYQAIWGDLKARGWDRSAGEGATAILRFTPGTGDCGMLAPSIQFLTLYEASFYGTAKTRMDIAGLFGQDPGASKREVTIADTPVEVVTWAADRIQCDIPNFGQGSVGDVVVSVGGHKSNKVPLTEWNIPFTYTRHSWGSLTDTFHINVHIRADVHDWRDKPHETPNKATVVLFKGMSDMDGDWASEGEGYQANDPDQSRLEWKGSGSLSGEHAMLDGEGVSAIGFVDVQSMALVIMPLAMAGMQKTVDMYLPDGTHVPLTQAPYVPYDPVFDELVETQGYIRIPLDSGFGIAEGSRTARTMLDGSPLPDGEAATLQWGSAAASFAPDPTVHASGVAAP